MSKLLSINVNEHIEKKNGLSYLSWAWAWSEVLKIDAAAKWEAHEWNGFPAMFLPDGSAMVKVSVTINGDTKTCPLPVMDHRNKAIKNPDAFAINTATMRALAKAISMHGLGLYIYAGEDLPEQEQNAAKDRQKALDELAADIVAMHEAGQDIKAAAAFWAPEAWSQDNPTCTEEQKYVWGLLSEYSALRRVIKANNPQKEAA